MWVPLGRANLERVFAQVERPGGESEADLAELARRFFVNEGDAFHFSSATRVVGHSRVAMATLSAFKFVGGGPCEPGIMHIGFLLNGSMTIRLGDTVDEFFKAGSVYASSSGRSASLESSGMTRGLLIQVPHDRILQRGVRLRRERLRIESPNSLVNPLRAFALTIIDPAWAPTAIGELIVERSLEDLVVGLLLECDGYAMDSEDLRSELRFRAIELIAKKHQDASLNPAVLAAQMGVSLRHLQRSFEGSGSSIAETIKLSRCRSAALFLARPRKSDLTLAEIAKRSGFQTAAELRCCFRAHYGTLPSDFRANLDHARDETTTDNARFHASLQN